MSTQNPDGPGLDRKGLPTSPVMQCFWDLASINDNERREAVRRLVAHAAEAQQSFEQIGSIASGLPSSESGAGDALGLCSDVHYALKRCVPVDVSMFHSRITRLFVGQIDKGRSLLTQSRP